MSTMNLGKVRIDPKGTWSSANSYEFLNTVYDTGTGSSYMALQNVPTGTAITDTDYWEMLCRGFAETDVTNAVNAWLDAHPEATTTVQDNSITDAKLVQSGGVLSEVEQIESDIYKPFQTTEVVSLSSLTVYANGKYMNRDGDLTNGTQHKVVSMPVGNIEKLQITSAELFAYSTLPIAVLKDAEDAFVSYLPCSNTSYTYEYSIPSQYSEGTIYINWWSYATTPPQYYDSVTVVRNTSYEVKFLTEDEVDAKIEDAIDFAVDGKANLQKFSGKNVYAFGDSIVVGYTTGSTTTSNNFCKVFCEQVGATLTNYGKASALFTSGYNSTQTITDKIETTNLSGADILLIAGGVNDCQLGVTESDFKTAISGLMTWLKSNYSGVVIFVLPINFSRTFLTQISDLELYRDYIRTYATINGFITINTTDYGFPKGTSPSQTSLAQLLFGDGLHPTELGHELYGKSLAKDINVLLEH